MPAARHRRRVLGALTAAAVWAIVVPYAADLGIPSDVEFVDHVAPGCIVIGAASATLYAGWTPGTVGWLVAGSGAALAGFWITATHVPLVPEALDGTSPAFEAALHLSTGPPVLLIGVAMLLARRA